MTDPRGIKLSKLVKLGTIEPNLAILFNIYSHRYLTKFGSTRVNG